MMHQYIRRTVLAITALVIFVFMYMKTVYRKW